MKQVNPSNPGPDPARPLMIQRLRIGVEKPEIWTRLFQEFKRNRACCDEVWFSTGVGIPVLEEHRRRSELIARYAEELRSIGIIPSLQVQATIGHRDSVCEAAGMDAKTWGSYVGIHGEQCTYINCPRQPGFLEYMRQMAEIYAQWQPGSVWIDDDLRLFNHFPAYEPGGCCCPYCLELFSNEEGRIYSREDIERAYEAGSELKSRWDEFSKRSLQLIVQAIVDGIYNYSPDSRIALQHCSHDDRLAVLDFIYRASGKRTASRPGGGTYSDHNPYWMVDKGIFCAQQRFSQPGYEILDQICPEIESCPRIFTCKTSQGHRLESLFYLAMGMDSLSYFIMDAELESVEWYGRELLAPLAAEAECYRSFIRHNENTLPGGVGLPFPAEHPRIVTDEAGLPLVGVPFGGYSPMVNCFQIIGKAAETLSKEALTEALRGDVLVDGKAVEIICKRGLGAAFCGITACRLERPFFEYYTDDPLNTGLEIRKNTILSNVRFMFDIPANLNVRVLGTYKDTRQQDYGNASLLLTRPDGSRVAMLGYDGFNTFYISSSRARFLNRVADWVAHGRLAALTDEPVQCFIVPRLTADGMLKSVVVLNASIGQRKPFDLRLRSIPANAEVEWLVPAETPQKLELKSADGELYVTLPEISPWDIGWLKISY